MADEHWEEQQREICAKYGATFLQTLPTQKLGISLEALNQDYPVHGLRIAPESGTSGWYVYAGDVEPSTAVDYYKALHCVHLTERRPEIIAYLGLPPGWRFLLAPNYVDVWLDRNLLQ